MAGNLLLQVHAAAALVLDRRFGRGDSLAVGGNLPFRLPDFLGNVVDVALDFQQLRFVALALGRRAVPLVAERLQLGLKAGQSLAQPLPIDQANLGPQFLQPIGVLFVAAGLAGLGANAAEPGLDLVDNVGQPQQVLFDAFQAPQGFELADLKTADAGCFLENHPAIPRRRLKQDVDLALLDHAVGLRAHARPRQQVANVAEPGRVAVDQVLALAAAINAAGNVDFGRVDAKLAFRVVEGERDLGGVGGPAAAGTVKNHVGHLAAAKAFDALLAQHPFDGVDDI